MGGHSLLKKKAEALQMRFRSILKKIIDTKQIMGEIMKEASSSLAEAKFATGDFNQVVLQNVNKAQIKIRTRKDNVAGVNLPVFEAFQDGADVYELAGLAKGGQQLKRMKATYGKAITLLVELASLQTSFVTLDLSSKRPTEESTPSNMSSFQRSKGRWLTSFQNLMSLKG